MNEQQLREALQQIARKEIPDTMDRWDEIQAQVRRRPWPAPWGWSLARILIVFAVLLMALGTLAVGYAIFNRWFDPGMQSVEEAGLITPVQVTALPTINATPTALATTPMPTPLGTAESGGVIATLDSVYADEQRLAITYTVRNLPPQDPKYRVMFQTNISYADGSLFNASSGGGADPGVEPNSMIVQQSFEHHEPMPENGIVDVVFTIQVVRLDTSEPNNDFETLYTFEFPVTLTVIKGVDVQVEQTQTVNGIAVSLRSVTITPAATQLIVCYDLPPGSLDWTPEADLTLDGQKGLPLGWGMVGAKTDPIVSPHCIRMTYSTPYKPGAKHLTFTVRYLRNSPDESYPQERLDRATERLAAQGIEVSFKRGDQAFGWDIIRKPEGMDEATVNKAVYDALSEQVHGPWVFEVDIPQGQ